METIDELVVRLVCTDGVLYVSRPLLLKVSGMFKSLTDDSSSFVSDGPLAPVNDVNVPFDKSTFQTVLQLISPLESKSVWWTAVIKEQKSRLEIKTALAWLAPTPGAETRVKQRLGQKMKPIQVDADLFKFDQTRPVGHVFESIAKNGWKILVQRTFVRDFDAISCSYTVYDNMDELESACLTLYLDGREEVLPDDHDYKFKFVHPEHHHDELMMFYEADRSHYVDGYGISDEEYLHLYEYLKSELEELGGSISTPRDC